MVEAHGYQLLFICCMLYVYFTATKNEAQINYMQSVHMNHSWCAVLHTSFFWKCIILPSDNRNVLPNLSPPSAFPFKSHIAIRFCLTAASPITSSYVLERQALQYYLPTSITVEGFSHIAETQI